MSFNNITRRQFIKMSTATTALMGILPHQTIAALANQQKIISLRNLHTGESLEACYFDGVQYIDAALNEIDHLCRDFRQNEVFPIDKKLLLQIDAIQTVLQTQAEVQVISAYRSPMTNEELRSKSGGVAKKSMHMQGKALDFRLEGVALSDVKKAAHHLKMGGVGYYPSSNFLHIDTGHVRFW